MTGRMSRANLLERLDECTQAIYKCSFQEFLVSFSKLAFDDGFEKGKREGRTTGRRAAKGLPEARQKRGRPSNIDEGMKALLMYHVETRKQQGATVREATREFLEIMREGGKTLRDNTHKVPSSATACETTYYRHRNKLD